MPSKSWIISWEIRQTSRLFLGAKYFKISLAKNYFLTLDGATFKGHLIFSSHPDLKALQQGVVHPKSLAGIFLIVRTKMILNISKGREQKGKNFLGTKKKISKTIYSKWRKKNCSGQVWGNFSFSFKSKFARTRQSAVPGAQKRNFFCQKSSKNSTFLTAFDFPPFGASRQQNDGQLATKKRAESKTHI